MLWEDVKPRLWSERCFEQVLYIGDNRIKTIYGDTFSYMRSLKVLRVDSNGLSAVYEKTFQGLHSLLSLSLDHNDLRWELSAQCPVLTVTMRLVLIEVTFIHCQT